MSLVELEKPRLNEVKDAILRAGVWQEKHFKLADGGHALVKLEFDKLWKNPSDLQVILDNLVRAEGLPQADVILGVPTGGQLLAEGLIERDLVDVPIAHLERVPEGARQDFRFCTGFDKELALSAQSPRIYEDVVSTLSSIAGVVRLLKPEHQDIHSLAIWRRGETREKYKLGFTDHYLIEEEIPIFTPDTCPHCHPEQ